MSGVRTRDLAQLAPGARINLWSLDTEAELEALLAPGGLDPLAMLLGAGDRVAFVAGADRVHGDLAILESVPAKGDERAVVQTHLVWSTRPPRSVRKAA